jgi:hypothetical protein
MDVFFKQASDTLPPHRSYDYKIELEDDHSLGHASLYKISLEKLQAAKTSLLDNLAKGFIVPSSALYASPILMAKKPGGGLQFYVDFRKLNTVTKKNCYPLSLINEILE